ncbi:hypothetical protein BH20ACT19_BH20ACT19_13000 [soil metagenome]
MRTAIVSDLHLGTTSDADVASRPAVRERLLDALADADRVVLLGDVLELRERRVGEALELARPFLAALGEATAGKQVTIVPGNHDYELIAGALDHARLDGRPSLPVAATFDTSHGDLSRRVADLMPRTEVTLGYPGVWLREDVYATHGHYLDLHLSVPRVECVLASAIARFAASIDHGARPTPDFYEAALSPIYAFGYSLVQGAEGRAVTRGGNLTRAVWDRSGRRSPSGLALGLAIPTAVTVLNSLGLGPFRGDVSALELRRAGLRAMAAVVAALGIDAEHVVFGHTHRSGPLPGEAEGWWLPGDTQLTNTGSWLFEEVFVRGSGPSNPYWPGRIAWLEDQEPPRLAGVLDDLDVANLLRTRRTP